MELKQFGKLFQEVVGILRNEKYRQPEQLLYRKVSTVFESLENVTYQYLYGVHHLNDNRLDFIEFDFS